MKLKKGVLLTGITLVALTAITAFSGVQAASESKNLRIKMIRESGYGYELANSEKNVWKIYEDGGKGETIYCLRGGPGFGSSDMANLTPTSALYNRYFNLKAPDSISSAYLDALIDPSSKDYERLMWVLDNCYVAPKTNASTSDRDAAEENRKMLLDAAIKYAEEKGNPDATDYEFEFLTDDDIDAVQQVAVWHFTNPSGAYHIANSLEFWVNSVRTVDGNYNSLNDHLDNGNERAIACQALFDYLVQIPKKSGFSYDYTQNQNTSTPAEIANTTVSVQTVNGRLVVGPYKINQLRDIEYTLTGQWIDGKGTTISDVKFLNNNQQQVANGTTLKDLVGQNFYISIPLSTNTTNIEFNIEGTYFTTTTEYWSVQNPGASDQPVVIIEKTKNTFSDSTNHSETPEPETPEFDLALRKFIISINGVALTTDRTPTITNSELNSLANGTKTTAEKVHPKNALTVKTGDKVTYTIRIYNEGQVDGYATEVTDYLPTGLKFVPTSESETNRNYGWSNPNGDGKTIVTNYLQDKLIPAFSGTNLQYQDLKIECEVIATVQAEDQNLKNIAEITAHKDKYGNTQKDGLDRDSEPDNVKINNYGTTSQQDDDDFEHLVLLGQYFDLSLRKFITNVTDTNNKSTAYDRAPKVDVSKLASGAEKTAIYNHPKTPIGVSNGDIVTYTIRVYNEGQVDGYVTEIKDHLPAQLEFIVNDELNAKYGWTILPGSNGRTVTTNITSPTTSSSASRDEIYATRRDGNDKVLLKAFNGKDLDNKEAYIDVQIRCKVKEDINLYEKITNIAEISSFTDSEGNVIADRDSKADDTVIPSDETLPIYKDTEIERGDSYIPGQNNQDDNDFEKLVLQRFDLALRKFITGVISGENKTEIGSRVPVFKKTEDGKYYYDHTKEPVDVANGNTVIYTLRIFNEGNVDGYAQEVKDDIPDGLEFLPEDELNKTYRWKMYKEDGTETTDVSEAKTIKTDYLAKEQEKTAGDNLIKAFEPETMTMPDYKDVQIAFKVTEPDTSDRIIINTAEIAEDADKEGNPVDDVDSTPNNDKEGEDDIDIEKIKVKYFDLALRKWVTESIVTYNGKTTVTKTGNKAEDDPETPAKVEIRGSRISKTTVKFKFNIKVTNEGEIAGYVKELIDYVPEGLKFEAKDNPKWREEDGKILTDQLKDTLLQPGESATVEIILTWINSKDNLGEKINWAEIYEDDNEYDSPDIDSTPGNNVKGEDDIDEAPVILSVVTGSVPTYVTLAIASISMMAGGVVLIKKFVI